MIYMFEVTGSGKFPVWLLSNGAWPATKDDANKLLCEERRTIQLKGTTLPNKVAWSSFGWNCLHFYCEERDDLNLYHTWPC